MTIEEIFSKLAIHMVEGIMMHNEFAQQFNFLGLEGFAFFQYSHQLEETQNYLCLCNYYTNHYHKLIENVEIIIPKLIPQSWYKYTSMAVDTKTRYDALKTIMNKWINWEIETKKLYQNMYNELIQLKEIATATQINCFIEDVSEELAKAEQNLIRLELTEYDWTMISDWNQSLKKKYKKKLGW